MARADDYVEAAGGVAALKRHCNGDKTLLAAIMANCANTAVGVWSENSIDRTVVVAVYGQPK